MAENSNSAYSRKPTGQHQSWWREQLFNQGYGASPQPGSFVFGDAQFPSLERFMKRNGSKPSPDATYKQPVGLAVRRGDIIHVIEPLNDHSRLHTRILLVIRPDCPEHYLLALSFCRHVKADGNLHWPVIDTQTDDDQITGPRLKVSLDDGATLESNISIHLNLHHNVPTECEYTLVKVLGSVDEGEMRKLLKEVVKRFGDSLAPKAARDTAVLPSPAIDDMPSPLLAPPSPSFNENPSNEADVPLRRDQTRNRGRQANGSRQANGGRRANGAVPRQRDYQQYEYNGCCTIL